MRVFVSHSSQQRAMAERIAVTLGAEGHRVFFDRSAIEAGDAAHARVRQEVRGAYAMVFLIDPLSVEEESLARTELRIAEREWSSFSQRVVPVMAEPVPTDQVPAVLHDAEVIGVGRNLESEVSYAVDRIARARRRARLGYLAMVVAAVVVLALSVTVISIAMQRDDPADRSVAAASATAPAEPAPVRAIEAPVEDVATTRGEPAASPGSEGGATGPGTTSSEAKGPPTGSTGSGSGPASSGGGDPSSADVPVVARAPDPSAGARCRRTREATREAFSRRAWWTVLDFVSTSTCWRGKDQGDYVDMKVKALFETKQWVECARMARQAKSAGAKRMVKVCQVRIEVGP